jgi:hypothetical protein
VELLVANPGVVPAPGYADTADVIVSFEGTWGAYRGFAAADWMLGHPPDRFCHLVHDCPPDVLPWLVRGARGRHAGTVYATELTGANPWSRLGADLRRMTEPRAAV